MEINKQLNEIAVSKGIKQIFIAEKTGLTADTVSKIFMGKRKIMADEFLTICAALELDPRNFIKRN